MSKKTLTNRQKKIIGIVSIVITILVLGLATWIVGKPLIHFVSEPEKFREWVDSYGFLSRIAFLGMVILQIIIAFIPGEPFEIVAGYAFGVVEGTLLCILGAIIGSILVFSLVRLFGKQLVEVFFPKEKLESIQFLKSAQNRNILFFIIYTIPGTPKDLLSYFAGLTDISLKSWLFICTVGRIPSVITSTIGGDSLGTKNYWFSALVFGITFVISGLGILLYKWILKKKNNTQKSKDEK